MLDRKAGGTQPVRGSGAREIFELGVGSATVEFLLGEHDPLHGPWVWPRDLAFRVVRGHFGGGFRQV